MKKFSLELPVELVTEILARLPVKSLVQFRSVCKAWCSLISSPGFASLHLSRYHNNDDTTLHLVKVLDVCSSPKYQWTVFSSRTYEKIANDDYAILNNRRIMDRVDSWRPCGSPVNGLLLCKAALSDVPRKLQLLLWNPMIGKSHTIPAEHVDNGAQFGLGCISSRIDDHKVVKIAKTVVRVYSLSTCTWTSVVGYRESIISHVYSDGFPLVEGRIYFLSDSIKEQSSHMVLFDVNDEAFRYIELPSEAYWKCKCPVVYLGMIGLLHFQADGGALNLWILEKDKVPGSWSKVHTIVLEQRWPLIFLCFKNNGEFLMNGKGEMKLYDIKSGEVKHIGKRDEHWAHEHWTLYKESLLLL